MNEAITTFDDLQTKLRYMMYAEPSHKQRQEANATIRRYVMNVGKKPAQSLPAETVEFAHFVRNNRASKNTDLVALMETYQMCLEAKGKVSSLAKENKLTMFEATLRLLCANGFKVITSTDEIEAGVTCVYLCPSELAAAYTRTGWQYRAITVLVYSDSLNEGARIERHLMPYRYDVKSRIVKQPVPTHRYTYSCQFSYGLNGFVPHQIVHSEQINREFVRVLDQDGKYALYCESGLIGCVATQTEIREFMNEDLSGAVAVYPPAKLSAKFLIKLTSEIKISYVAFLKSTQNCKANILIM